MARFSFGPGGANRQLLRLERLEARDCPSGLGGHVQNFAGILPAPPTPPAEHHAVIVHHQPAGTVAQSFGIIEVPPTPPAQHHAVVVHHQPVGTVAQPFAGIVEVPPTPPPPPTH